MKLLKAWSREIAEALAMPSSQPQPLAPAPRAPPPPAASAEAAAAGPVHMDASLQRLLCTLTRSVEVRRQYLRLPAERFSERRPLSVHVCTYNVAGRAPPAGACLSELLLPPGDDVHGPAGPDIMVAGFQEAVPLSAGNVLSHSLIAAAAAAGAGGGPGADAGGDAWEAAVAASLNGADWGARYAAAKAAGGAAATAAAGGAASSGGGAQAAAAPLPAHTSPNLAELLLPDGQPPPTAGAGVPAQPPSAAAAAAAAVPLPAAYLPVASRQMVGLFLTVWVRRPLAAAVSGVATTAAATGFGGFMGNKGAVAIRCQLYDTSFCAVCAHLAAGEAAGDAARRDADFSEILRRCAFAGVPGGAPLAAGAGGAEGAGDLTVPDHDCVVWLGDLNYRLDMADADARRAIAARRPAALLAADQLSAERAAGRVFQGWAEGAIAFLPTYKFHIGGESYVGDGPGPSGGASGAPAAGGDEESAEADAMLSAVSVDPPGKRRTPAYTDRILWRPHSRLRQLRYARAELKARPLRRSSAAALLLGRRSASRAPGRAHPSQLRRSPPVLPTPLPLLAALRPPPRVGGVLAGGAVVRRAPRGGGARRRPPHGRRPNDDGRPAPGAGAAHVRRRPAAVWRIAAAEGAPLRFLSFSPCLACPLPPTPPCVRPALSPLFTSLIPLPLTHPNTHATQAVLRNVGDVEADFSFVAPPGARRPLPPWLTVAPPHGRLAPGESLELQLTACVTGQGGAAAGAQPPPRGSAASSAAAGANGGASSRSSGGAGGPPPAAALDAVAVLRVAGGGDAFLLVRGSYVRSAFGLPLTELRALGGRPVLAKPTPAQALILRMPLPSLSADGGGGGGGDDGASDAGSARSSGRRRRTLAERRADAAAAAAAGGGVGAPAALAMSSAGGSPDASAPPTPSGGRPGGNPFNPFNPFSISPLSEAASTSPPPSLASAGSAGPLAAGAAAAAARGAFRPPSPAGSSGDDAGASAFASEAPWDESSLVPKEVARLLDVLSTGDRLAAPGVLWRSAAIVRAAYVRHHPEAPAEAVPCPTADAWLLAAAVAPLRAALDAGRPLPAGAGPHHAAAALLALLQQLPGGLLPLTALEVVGSGTLARVVAAHTAAPAPSSAASSSPPPPAAARATPLAWGAAGGAAAGGGSDVGRVAELSVARAAHTVLRLELGAPEAATLSAILALARRALQPALAARSGATPLGVARALAEHLFAPPPPDEPAGLLDAATARAGLLLALLLNPEAEVKPLPM